MHLRNVTALLAQLWSSPFNLYRGHIFVNTGGCLCIFIQINLEVLNWCVIILSNCSSWFGSTLCPFSCREMNGLWGECSPHTSLICHWPLRENGHLPASAWLQTVIHPILLEQSEAPPHALLLPKSFPTAGRPVMCCLGKGRKERWPHDRRNRACPLEQEEKEIEKHLKEDEMIFCFNSVPTPQIL